MFGINGAEFLVLLVVAVVVVGPERLPRYAEQLAHAVRRFRAFVGDAKERVATELGDDADLDWEALDPRRYDPRRIVREALLEPDPPAAPATASAAAVYVSGRRPSSSAVQSASVRRREAEAAGPAPFDDEAT